MNGQTVTFALGEEWCFEDGQACQEPGSYKVTWAKEFRYDGSRQRYLERELDTTDVLTGTITPLSKTVTDYDGDEPYLSWVQPAGGSPTYTGYELGIARIHDPGGTPSTEYYHTDMLGTTRFLTDDTGSEIDAAAYTAFGERASGTSGRFGYVGAFGYQTHAEMPYLHVGARYYDPSSGRFLQRDPIGIRSGSNVYMYVNGNPVVLVDPDGLDFWGSVGGGFLWITGGRHSWLDRPQTVKKVRKTLHVVALVCGGVASPLSAAAKVPLLLAGGTANVWW